MELNVRNSCLYKLEVQSKKQNKHGKTKRFLKQCMAERFLFLFEFGSNIVTLMTIAEYGKYTDIEEDKPSRTVENPNKTYTTWS